MFPTPRPGARALARVLAALAGVSALRQGRGRRHRDGGLHPAVAVFDHRQDRRLLAALVMAAIVAGMACGLTLNPKADRVCAS